MQLIFKKEAFLVVLALFVVTKITTALNIRRIRQERLCADVEILKQKFPQASDCILTWMKRLPDNVDKYCKSKNDLADFCSRLDKYKKANEVGSCGEYRSNLDYWFECMAYMNSILRTNCNQDSKCKEIPLYKSIPYCNKKKDIDSYVHCMESGSEEQTQFLKGEYMGVPTYMIAIICVLCVVIGVLLILYKVDRKRRQREAIEAKEEEEEDITNASRSTMSSTSLKSTGSNISNVSRKKKKKKKKPKN